ncbi:MAG: hypothetical protein KC636_33200, partial [Myxococcales bacterium]|nr:hypothetical protein [Myxococcales bacterium]
MPLSKAEARKIIKEALAAATFADVRVAIQAGRERNLRFANNQATTSGDVERLSISVTAIAGGRAATVTGNRRDKAGLTALVAQAEAQSALAPVDPEVMPPVPAQRYLEVDAFDAKTAALDAKGLVDVVARAVRVANRRKLVGAGIVEVGERVDVVANKAGLFAHVASTGASLTTTMRSKDGAGSGWAGAVSHRVAGLDADALADVAADKCEMSQGTRELKPGRYVVLLEPQAVADLLGFLRFSMSARAADEGRSYFSKPGGGNRIGEQLFSPSITLRSDPGDAHDPSSPVGEDGLPLAPMTWVEHGVLQALPRGRFWAKTTGAPAIPRPRSLLMSGGQQTIEALITGIERGVLVTRLWYNRLLDPRTILTTGLTRDGTFAIEKGALAGPVKNMRYN